MTDSPWNETAVGVRLLSAVADAHDCALAMTVDVADVAPLAPYCEVLRQAIDTLRMAVRDLEATIVDGLPIGAVIGNAEVVKSSGWVQVRWDELMPTVVAYLADTPGVVWSDDGEKLPGHVIAENLVRELRKCVGFSSPKRPGLAALGLDLDEYATRKPATTIRWAKQ